MDHIHDLVNNSPEAGAKTPMQGLEVIVLILMVWSASVHCYITWRLIKGELPEVRQMSLGEGASGWVGVL